VYAAEVHGQPLTFEVAGVYRRNMIIRDRQTGTLWQHATGEALLGALKGAQLQPVGGELIRWSKWKELNPHTTLALEPIPENGRFPGLIPRHRLEHLLKTFTTNHAASGTVRDHRLPMHEEIVGVSLAGVNKAYPLAVIRNLGIIYDRVGENWIAVAYDRDADHVSVLNCQVADQIVELVLADGALSSRNGWMRWTWMGEPLTTNTPPLIKYQIERQKWLGWVEFHPTSDVYLTEEQYNQAT
jgi:hypothetical protein